MIKLKNYIRSMELRKKFNSITVLSIVFACLLFLIISLVMIEKYDKLLYETNAKSLDNIVNNVEAKLEAVSVLTDHLISNQSIQSNLMTLLDTKNQPEFYRAKENTYSGLYNYLYSNADILSITLVLDNATIHIGDSFKISDNVKEDLAKTARDYKGNFFLAAGERLGGQVILVREIRQKAYVSLRHLATLYISIDIDDIVKKSLTETSSNNYNFILFAEDSIIAPTGAEYNDIYKTLLDEKSRYNIKNIQHKKQFIVRGNLPNINWDYLYFIDYGTVFKSIQTMKLQGLLIIIAIVIVNILLTNLLIRRLLRYFQILVDKMKHFGSGNLDLIHAELDYTIHTDELGELNRNFDEMVINFNQLINDNYVKQLLLKDAQIKMLQQQINPHFLYNTLDTINWMSQSHGADDIALIARSLGNLFRGSIEISEDFITLEKELEFLNNYILIQSFRFKERLTFEMNVKDNHKDLLIPKMILQPLIENAIKHGLENSFDTCIIRLTLTVEEKVYQLKVSNSCSAFEHDLLERLERKELVPEGTGVGLTNIDKRLKLIYGEEYGLYLYNEEEMAVAVVSIPKGANQLGG